MKVVAVADIACSPREELPDTECEMEATADLTSALDPDLVLVAGDLQYPDGELADFEAGYDKTWGRFKGITKPAVGNHEYHSGATGYLDYFGLDGTYQSFDVGGWHFVALDSNCDEVGGCGPGSVQYEWLADDLGRSEARCTLAYWHHPRFSSGQHGSDERTKPFWDLLEAEGADLVINGHDHSYERFAPRSDIRQFTVGTGGRSLYPFSDPLPASELRRGADYGVLALTLRADGYDWAFVAVGGAALDSGSGRC